MVVQSRVKPSASKLDTTASASMVDVLLSTLTKALLVLSIPCTLVGFEVSLSASAEAPWPDAAVRGAEPEPRVGDRVRLRHVLHAREEHGARREADAGDGLRRPEVPEGEQVADPVRAARVAPGHAVGSDRRRRCGRR